MKKIFVFTIFAPLFGLILCGSYIAYHLYFVKYPGPQKEFIIHPGDAFARINFNLKKEGIIQSAKLFHRYAYFTGIMKKMRPGTYDIKPNITMASLANLLVEGKTKTYAITIPEGKNIYEIGKILEKKKICSYNEFIKYAKDPALIKKLNAYLPTFEGQLYPETYHFNPNTSAPIVIKTMHNEFKKRIAAIDFKHPTLSMYELLILASIVEKETGAGWERPTIAGVFLNRLKIKMRLQSDPTTIYGIYETYNGNLKKKHLLQKTPYNTYKIKGLPKGPISNPGIESIKAVLAPKQHNYLYFVSYNDGTHKFSKSYKEHLKAVEKYQKNRANRQGKSWRDLKKKSL